MGFSADWLALREPADRAARNDALARRAAAAAGPAPRIVDLGCGTGATWRALTPYLPATAHWCFVDKDPELLAHAAAATDGAAEIVEADIADVATLPLASATLVTASALLDLVTDTWIQELARQLNAPLYAALTFSGTMRWDPGDPRDADISAAFNRHQHGDKGLGQALGPEAGKRAVEIFVDAGFEVQCADSPWCLGPQMAVLQRALTDGIADAAAEAGAAEARAWGLYRREAAEHTHSVIDHVDMLAIPGHSREGAHHAVR